MLIKKPRLDKKSAHSIIHTLVQGHFRKTKVNCLVSVSRNLVP